MHTTAEYGKYVVQAISGALFILAAAITDNTITDQEVVAIVIAGLTGVGVYLVPRLTGTVGRYSKGIVAFVGAAVQAVALLVDAGGTFGGISPSEWLYVLLAALAAVGVVIVPNAARGVAGRHTTSTGVEVAYDSETAQSTEPVGSHVAEMKIEGNVILPPEIAARMRRQWLDRLHPGTA
jgi:hypothetical protein